MEIAKLKEKRRQLANYLSRQIKESYDKKFSRDSRLVKIAIVVADSSVMMRLEEHSQ